MATNQEKYRTQYMKVQMGFEETFDNIFSSAEIGFKKPNPDFYKSIVDLLKKQYNISRNQISYIDDSAANVESANRTGMKSYLFESFELLDSGIIDKKRS
ncbi:HAD-IA family hydrolase [Patescibacteria group bacterium]|nr:HAD-IA family hydrolase [Patescibacteria group bacterium]